MSTKPVAEAIRIESESGPTDETKSVRVRRGVYRLRNTPGYYMIRVRVPGGVITTDQLEAVAELSRESGWEPGVHLTTRAGLELAGIPGAAVCNYLTRLEVAGLTTVLTGGNAVRGVVCCPFSGVEPDEAFDVTPFALAVDRYYREHVTLTRMPRKIKIAFDSCPEDHVRACFTDIGILAVKRGEERGFRVIVGGGLGATPKVGQELEEFVPVGKLFPTIDAILRVFDREGDRKNRARARLKWLLAEWGIEKFRDAVRAEPVEGPFPDELAFHVEDFPLPPVSFLGVGAGAVSADRAQDFSRWSASNVLRQRQAGLAAVAIRVPFGDISPEQLNVVAEAARLFGGGLRTSIEQNIVLRGVRVEALPALYQFLLPAGLATCCAGKLLDVTRCVGSSACLSAITSSRAAAADITRALEAELGYDPTLQHLRVRVSGCPNSCSHHHASDIGLYGISKKINGRSVPHYALLAGGSALGEATGVRVIDIPAARIGAAVERTVRLYRDEREQAESFPAFVARAGVEHIRETLQPLTEAPSMEDDPAFYRDLDAERDFKVESKKGECHY